LIARSIPSIRKDAEEETLAMVNHVLAEFVPETREKFRVALERVGILSLSSERDSLVMWTHYAEEHRGFLIEFDASHPWFDRRRAPDDEFYRLRRVRYEPPVRNGRALVELDGDAVFAVKSPEYRYEAEGRVVGLLADADRVLTTRSEGIHLFAVPPETVTGVIAGARASEHLCEELKALAASGAAFAHVRLERAILDLSRRELGFGSL
jgi:hypothetical protein